MFISGLLKIQVVWGKEVRGKDSFLNWWVGGLVWLFHYCDTVALLWRAGVPSLRW